MKNNQPDDYDTELEALDRLVNQEFNALQQKAGKTKCVKPAKGRKSRRLENVIYRDSWPKDNSARPDTITPQEATEPDNPESFEDEFDGELVEGDEQQSAPSTTQELFTEEELEFIQRTTEWLGSRGNKDLIMSRVWDLMAESVPESFYSVKDEESTIPSDSDSTDRPGKDASELPGKT